MDDDIREHLAASRFREAFELLLERYQRKVFRLAYSMLGEAASAEEMAQDVFLQIWKALPEFRGEASLSTWIFTITRNRCWTGRKKLRERMAWSIEEPGVQAAVDAQAHQGASPEVSKAATDLASLLAPLPPPYRQALTLFYLEEKSYEEVAGLLGLPIGTVRTYLHRGRKQLAESLAKANGRAGRALCAK